MDEQFQQLFQRAPRAAERVRLLSLGLPGSRPGSRPGLRSGADSERGADVLAALAACSQRRARRRWLALFAQLGLVVLLAWMLFQAKGRGVNVQVATLVPGAAVTGLALVALQFLFERVLGARSRRAAQIESLARRGDPRWIDEYAHWVDSGPSPARRHARWLSIPCGLACAMLVAREQGDCSRTGAMLTSVLAILAAYACLQFALGADDN